jgi:hypothetical protein
LGGRGHLRRRRRRRVWDDLGGKKEVGRSLMKLLLHY